MNALAVSPLHPRPRLRILSALCLLAAAALAFALAPAAAQDTGQTNISIIGSSKYRLAAPDFFATGAPADVVTTFNTVLWNDLYQSGWVEMVGKSLYTAQVPLRPTDVTAPLLAGWASPPLLAQRLVFGNMSVAHGLYVEGYLDDTTKPPGAAPMLARQYTDAATADGARRIAHKFADDIVAALGGGRGIAGSQIAFISNRTGSLEVWTMDYDGSNQRQRTNLKSIAYSPRISPDGTKLAFMSSAGAGGIRMLSLITNKLLPFAAYKGMAQSPAWSPDGKRLAFASTMDGSNSEIYTANPDGGGLKRLTFSKGYDNTSPAWNPKTGTQIAFVSSRSGIKRPQICVINADGGNLQAITTQGYAVSPSWSPNGLALALAWVRNGGGENDGSLDIWVYDLASQSALQLTHNGNRNDFPSWAPDGRHVVFQSGPPRRSQLFSVLTDGSGAAQLTTQGMNEMANWSWR